MVPGRIVVNSCSLFSRGDIVMLSLDLKSKYAETMSYGIDGIVGKTKDCVPYINLGDSDRTLYIDERFDGMTTVRFPMFAGFSVWAANTERYSCTVALMRCDNLEPEETVYFENDNGQS